MEVLLEFTDLMYFGDLHVTNDQKQNSGGQYCIT